MAEMKDSGIEWVGKIPENWRVLKNKYNFELSKEIIGTKWVETQLLSLTKYGIKAINDGEQTGKVPASLSTYQKVNKDDLVMCLFDLDCSAVFSGISDFDGMVSPAYKCIKCKAHLFPKYIDYYFRTVFVDRKYKRYSKNVRFSISADEFMNLPIIVPPKDMQINIAKFLDKKCAEVDALHTDIEKQIETLEEYKKSIITEAVTKGLDPDVEMKDSGISYIGNIPKHWKVTNLKYLGKCQNGISKGGEYFGNGFPFVSYGDVYKNYSIPQNVDGLIMSTKTEQNIYSVKYGDVFFTRTSETIEEIGFASTCLKSIDNSVFAGFLIRFRPTSNDLIPEFSKFYFRSNIHRKFFVKEMNLVTRASLSQNLLGRLPVLLPPLCEQQMIAKNLEKKCAEIDGAIGEKKEQLETLEQYKKSIIYEYVTGKKEVK